MIGDIAGFIVDQPVESMIVWVCLWLIVLGGLVIRDNIGEEGE